MKTLKIIIFLIFVSFNSISQVIEINTGVSSKLTDIVTGNTSIWVCGDSGTLLRSTNNGINWINFSGHGIPTNVNLVSICMTYPDLRIVTCGNSPSGASVYSSVDSGNSWNQVLYQPNGNALSVACQIFVGNPVGGRWSLWRSDWAGNYWDSIGLFLPQIGNETAIPTSILHTGDCEWQFYIGTNSGKIYRKIGGNWTTYSSLPENNIRVFNWTGGSGYIAGANLYHTSNYGSTWNIIPVPGSGNFISFEDRWFSTWYIREDNKIYFKDSTGAWIIKYTAPNGNYTRMKYTAFSLFALRNNGMINRITVPSSPTGIHQNNTEVPDKFALLQNYPNPFNPVTHFGFRIAEFGLVKLTIYDALGKEVTALINQQLRPGTYEADWDASAYPSGVYYYKLKVNTSQRDVFTETKKMVLIK